MLDFVLSHLPSIWTAVSGILGGGTVVALIKAYRTYYVQHRKNEQSSANLRSDQITEQSKRIDDLLSRIERLEEEQEAERKARVEAEVRNRQLKATVEAMSDKITQLVRMVEDLRSEAGMKPLTDKEKADLKSTPDFTDADTA